MPSELNEHSTVEQVSKHCNQEHETAVKIAKIMVDKILEELPEWSSDYGVQHRHQHYQEVKKELQKM